MSFKKAQMDTIKALENLYKEGGYMEKAQVCEAVDALHNKVFSLSYEDVYKRSNALLKKCKKLRE
ncbi:unnamed protein product [marine sediment metagenome]|uniref:Uncharacterized protein n=1 Tax=marine sediment metagenome TaxID=412755 RepID=X0ZPX5_9ZZZZ